jgi:hypothetical protein
MEHIIAHGTRVPNACLSRLHVRKQANVAASESESGAQLRVQKVPAT